jgi:sensor domain CHASE-containing protein
LTPFWIPQSVFRSLESHNPNNLKVNKRLHDVLGIGCPIREVVLRIFLRDDTNIQLKRSLFINTIIVWFTLEGELLAAVCTFKRRTALLNCRKALVGGKRK